MGRSQSSLEEAPSTGEWQAAYMRQKAGRKKINAAWEGGGGQKTWGDAAWEGRGRGGKHGMGAIAAWEGVGGKGETSTSPPRLAT